MFKLEEVSKTYKLSGGAVVHALDGISLTLPDKGMVFVVGKSGSGKSTFLNILGGLDKPSSGDVSFNGNRFSTFKDKQFSNYRNNVVGFIFQEFNLLDTMTVSENIAVPLSLQSVKEKGKRVTEALKKVELEGYEKRKTNQLSGGEKQRVAIARALVKEPKLILADEPTGNLDSETSGTVFKLLKKLSRDYLVVVVTHDLESAKEYSDYMVGLSDGKVLFNTCPATEEHSEPLKDYKTSLPFTVSLKMGVGNLLKKPVRSISTLLVMIATLFCLSITQFFLMYDLPGTLSHTIKESHSPLMVLKQWIPTGTNDSYTETDFTFKSLAYLQENYPNTYRRCSDGMIIKDSADLLNFGFEFMGDYLELDDSNMYISYTEFKEWQSRTDFYMEDDDGVRIPLCEVSYEDIIGKKLVFVFTDLYEESYLIAGIVNTDVLMPQRNKYERAFGSYPDRFFKPTYEKRSYYSYFDYSYVSDITFKSGGFKFTPQTHTAFTDDLSPSHFGNGCIILADGSVKNAEALSLLPNEVVLDFETYNELFGSDLTRFDYVDFKDDGSCALRMLPQHLNEPLEMVLTEKSMGIQMSYSYKIAGLNLYPTGEYSSREIIFSKADYADLFDTLKNDTLIINTSKIKNVKKFLWEMKKLDVIIRTAYTAPLQRISESFTSTAWEFIIISLLLFIVMILFVIVMISLTIMNRAKEIGVLKAMGANAKDLLLIFLTEAFILAFAAFAAGIASAFIGASYLNAKFASPYSLPFNVFLVNGWSILTVFCVSFLIPLLATIVPLLKIRKLKPSEAMRMV